MYDKEQTLYEMQEELESQRERIAGLKEDYEEEMKAGDTEEAENTLQLIEEAEEELESMLEAYEDEKHYGGKYGMEREMARVGMSYKDFM
jgi:ferric iron reductase protein FhuF